MHIAHIDIQNFRKLKSCRVELSNEKTVFVGANNSGKTSAMEALMSFLKNRNVSITDFTLSNWSAINKIGADWISNTDNNALDLTRLSWETLVPTIDVWLQVEDDKIHYVYHIIPRLDWSGGLLGVRLTFEPKDVEELYKGYKAAFEAAKNTIESRKTVPEEGKKCSLSLWPQSLREFLDKELHEYFGIRAYILDPSKCKDSEPQSLPPASEPLEGNPFNKLFKIHIINAQRGFSDPNTNEGSVGSNGLSSQLREYYDKHLDPVKLPNSSDLDALEAIKDARTVFDDKLKTSFNSAISELEKLNYPGFNDPQIVISSKVNPLDGLNHDAAVQFNVVRDMDTSSSPLYLPEKYNGLGYQNLISMVFKLIRYRDEWMRVGKSGKESNNADNFIEPLHLVLIEEPEAHLHAQVQQVFIKKAYGVLRNHANLREKNQFCTQMVVSTHSSHIAHEIDFTCLRYFQKNQAVRAGDVPCATVVNLTKTFGSDTDTSRFATRYLKTTHCDLFFADAVILVEGPAERMLIPHFIHHGFPELDRSYISLLEIGGSHAHRLKPLLELLGILTLIVTDLDSVHKNPSGKMEKIRPEKEKQYLTGNDTLKYWAPCKTDLDEVLSVSKKSKETSDGVVRIAYQCELKVTYKGKEESAIPYTFEDALVLSNIELFRDKTDSKGLIKKMANSVNKSTLAEARIEMFKALEGGKKAEMALELLYTTEPNAIQPPEYIREGLEWLKDKLGLRSKDFIDSRGEHD